MSRDVTKKQKNSTKKFTSHIANLRDDTTANKKSQQVNTPESVQNCRDMQTVGEDVLKLIERQD